MKKNLLFLALLFAVAPVWAQQGATSWTAEYFDQLDTNQDGRVSIAEYRHFMEGAFTKLDQDGNGQVTPDEAGKVLTPEQFARVDADGSGTIDRQEFMTAVMADFHRQDRNGDGYLSRD